MRSPAYRNRRRKERQKEAKIRQKEREKRSDWEQINLLNWRPGFSDREVTRLLERIDSAEKEDGN